MSRVPIDLVAIWVMTIGVAVAAPAAHHALSSGDTIRPGPIFRYVLKADRSPAVCKHILDVFNDRFTHLWDAPSLTSLTNDPAYSANGRYAFPRLPGVKHSIKATFEMRFLAWPTSPEFSAIHWKEGMAIPGGCPAGKLCPGEGPEPVLIAHFDFDNDGTTDTVIIQGAFPGYMDATNPINEYLTVWRNQTFTIRGVADLSKLHNSRNQTSSPIFVSGRYFRPFVYKRRTYVAKYVPQYAQLDDDPNAIPSWTWTPSREDMLVQTYSFTGRKDKVLGRPEWTISTVCDLRMKQVNNK